jgi:hypothetical protein
MKPVDEDEDEDLKFSFQLRKEMKAVLATHLLERVKTPEDGIAFARAALYALLWQAAEFSQVMKMKRHIFVELAHSAHGYAGEDLEEMMQAIEQYVKSPN